MTNNTRKSYTGKFKLEVALAAIKGDKPIEEICVKFDVAINQVYTWKSHIEENGGELFDDKRKKEKQVDDGKEIQAELEAVKKERDFLARVLNR